MKRNPLPAGWTHRLRADRRGVSGMLVGITAAMLLGITGLVVDLGHIKTVQRALQASADAAALAGAQQISTAPTSAVSTAIAYSAVAGGKNLVGNLTVTMASGYPALKCFTSTGVACTAPANANGIVVRQQATVNTWFAGMLGVPSVTVVATSTAGISGGLPQPLDVEIVLDTTASMNSADASCSIAGATRIACALAGVRTLLTTLAPSADRIGLMVFPGLQSSTQAQYDYDCSSSPQPKIAAYNASPVYQVVPLSSDYRTSNGAKTLNSSSDLALASGGVSPCPGAAAVGGVGTYYADAITTAQATLAGDGSSAQKVIILLSDGDANASSSNMPSGKAVNQCHEAITAAKAAAAAGTWVYAIAYGSPTSPTPGSCSTDTGKGMAISACQTMQQIASDPGKFYSDTVGGTSGCTSAAQPVSELVSLFQSIAYSLVPPRLLPDDTT